MYTILINYIIKVFPFIRIIVFPVILSALWISFSEFFRNSLLLRYYWIEHFHGLGIEFPENLYNGLVWGIWAFCFSAGVFIFSRKYTLLQSTFISWFVGFVYMWLVIGNLGVLPFRILYLAIPLSLMESFISNLIIFKLSSVKSV